MKKTVIPALTLLASCSTLFCCALPALFVMLGAGAAFGGLISNVPQLIWLSEHKTALFVFAGAMLTFSAGMQWKNRNAPCPADPLQATACRRLRRVSRGVFVFSLAMYATGFYFAFIAYRFV